MGEGKTRVILPMLALHWADGQQVVRLNFLPTLLDEASNHLQRYLTASVLRRKLFVMPFSRDVQLDEPGARAMLACTRYCQQVGATLSCLAPSQLSSLLAPSSFRFLLRYP
jgi:hypothetical protein